MYNTQKTKKARLLLERQEASKEELQHIVPLLFTKPFGCHLNDADRYGS